MPGDKRGMQTTGAHEPARGHLPDEARGFYIFDFSKGWHANENLMTPSRPYFEIQGGGLTIGLELGVWWTRSARTSQW